MEVSLTMTSFIRTRGRIVVKASLKGSMKYVGLHHFAFSSQLINSDKWANFLEYLIVNRLSVNRSDLAYICAMYEEKEPGFVLTKVPTPAREKGQCQTCSLSDKPLITIPCGSNVPHIQCVDCHLTWYYKVAEETGEGRCLYCRGAWVYPLSLDRT